MRLLPWLVAIVAVIVYEAATAPHGLGVSLDSVVYARAADSVNERGTLDVPLTRWDSKASYEPLAHFPPVLPLALAATGRWLAADSVTAGRLLNAACLFATVATLLLTFTDSGTAMFLMTALLVGPSFVFNYLWLWSEPLFLLSLVAVVRLSVAVVGDAAPLRSAILLGVVCGFATLTRYAGVSLFAGAMIALAAPRSSASAKARQLAGCAVAYAATVAPWLWWLATRSGPPREIGFYTDRLWGQVVRPLLETATAWFVPSALPLPVALAILAGVLVLVSITWANRARESESVTLGPLAYVTLTLLVVHVAFLVATRIVADPGMPFDERILSAALVLTAIALSDVVRTLCRARVSILAIVLVALIGLSNVSATLPMLAYDVLHGLGYANDKWKASETIAWLASTPPGVTIFSNAPDAIVARLPVTAKYTPQDSDADLLSEFVTRVAGAAPSMIVLFDDPHAGWLVPRERLLELPGIVRVAELSDSVIVSAVSR